MLFEEGFRVFCKYIVVVFFFVGGVAVVAQVEGIDGAGEVAREGSVWSLE